MIFKILNSSSNNYNAVRYNDKKLEKGTGELLLMKNFPSNIKNDSSPQKIKKYFKAISSQNARIKKPQFHAVLSTRYREHSKHELCEVAKDLMQEIGYGEQPYLVVFHNDTENNHVHIVSTRVSKNTGKKLNDSYEKIKSQNALSKILERKQGIVSNQEKLNKLLDYKFSSISQLKTLLDKNGYSLVEREGSFSIAHKGKKIKDIIRKQLVEDKELDKKRIKQLKAIISKYKNIYHSEVFRVKDSRKEKGIYRDTAEEGKIDFESELQFQLKKKFGIEIVFHHKDNRNPFGYTLIDNKTGQVFKGSQILKMDEVFDFRNFEIEKEKIERYKDYNINSEIKKEILLRLNPEIKSFMIFENKKKKEFELYRQIQEETRNYLKGGGGDGIKIINGSDNRVYVVNENHHHIEEIESLVGEHFYKRLQENELSINPEHLKNKNVKEIFDLTSLTKSFLKGEGFTQRDPFEDKLNKRKKKKKKRK